MSLIVLAFSWYLMVRSDKVAPKVDCHSVTCGVLNRLINKPDFFLLTFAGALAALTLETLQIALDQIVYEDAVKNASPEGTPIEVTSSIFYQARNFCSFAKLIVSAASTILFAGYILLRMFKS